jgi:hypothetical protein
MSLSDGYTVCSIGYRANPLKNERPSSNSARGSNFVSHNRGASCRGRLLRSSRAEHSSCVPCALLGCLNGLPLDSRFGRYKGVTDAHAGERCSSWRCFLCCGHTVRRLVSHVVCKRANGKPGAADGKASAEPGQGSKAAPQSRSI